MPNHSISDASHNLGTPFFGDSRPHLANGTYTGAHSYHFHSSEKILDQKKQEQAQVALAEREEQRLKMEQEINQQVQARLKKEKVEKFEPNFALAEASA